MNFIVFVEDVILYLCLGHVKIQKFEKISGALWDKKLETDRKYARNTNRKTM